MSNLMIADEVIGQSGFPLGPMSSAFRLEQFRRSEAVAAATYQELTSRLDESDSICCRGLLRQLQEEHELAAESFGQILGAIAPLPVSMSDNGVWEPALRRQGGLFEHMAGGFSTLQHLRDAEVGMLEEYVTRLSELDEAATQFVREQLLPAQRRHVRTLRELLGETADA